MRILAIDPGSIASAYVIANSNDYSIIAKDRIDNSSMLNVIASNNYDVVVIEEIKCYGMPVGDSVIKTCFWIGRFMQAASKPHILIPRKTIVSKLCGHASASDSNVRQALIDIYGEQKLKGFNVDTRSALALFHIFATDLKNVLD